MLRNRERRVREHESFDRRDSVEDVNRRDSAEDRGVNNPVEKWSVGASTGSGRRVREHEPWNNITASA